MLEPLITLCRTAGDFESSWDICASTAGVLGSSRDHCVRSARDFERGWDHCAMFVGDFESSWDLCESSAGELMPYSHSSGSKSSTPTRDFMYHICLCYGHKCRYIMIWHEVFKFLYIHLWRYRENGDGLGDREYIFESPMVQRHHRILQSTHSIFPCSWSHALLPSVIDTPNSCGFSHTLAKRSLINAICVVYHGLESLHFVSPFSYPPRARNALSPEFPSDAMRGAAERWW